MLQSVGTAVILAPGARSDTRQPTRIRITPMNDPSAPSTSIPTAAILAQLPDAVIYSDPAGKVVIWNAAATRLFGFTAEEVLGQSLDVIIPERFRRAHWDGFNHAVRTGKVRHAGEVRLTRSLHKDGRKLYITTVFGLIHAPDGSVEGVVATARLGEAPQRSGSPGAPPA